MPDQKGHVLPLRVALIRDLRRHVPSKRQGEETDEDVRKPAWWQAEWKAEPTPASPTTTKLIPIVTTADTVDVVELAQTYTRRWQGPRNIIRNFLLPLGLDTNHGFAKVAVENSEVAKRRACLKPRLTKLKQWTQSASKREVQASKRRERLRKEYKSRSNEL